MDQKPVLTYQAYGDDNKNPSLILMHGLFGNKKNWGYIAQQLQANWHVIAVDLRNHGESFHDPNMLYPTLATDIINLCTHLQIQQAAFIGHSLGGKVLLQLLLQAPALVLKAVVVDIGPLNYPPQVANLEYICSSLQAIPINHLQSFAVADQILAQYIDNTKIRQFLLTNLKKKENGFYWRIPINYLKQNCDNLNQFPNMAQANLAKVSFIYGALSEYLNLDRQKQTLQYFPKARFFAIENVAHWVHSESPTAFLKTVKKLL